MIVVMSDSFQDLLSIKDTPYARYFLLSNLFLKENFSQENFVYFKRKKLENSLFFEDLEKALTIDKKTVL